MANEKPKLVKPGDPLYHLLRNRSANEGLNPPIESGRKITMRVLATRPPETKEQAAEIFSRLFRR